LQCLLHCSILECDKVCFCADFCRIISAGCCIIFSHCFHAILYCSHCFFLLHSHMTSTIYCCIIYVIVLHSYKIPLFLWYLAYCNCMYVATVSIEMCLPVNYRYECVAEYKIVWIADIVVDLTVILLTQHIVSELHLTKATRNLNVPYTHAEA